MGNRAEELAVYGKPGKRWCCFPPFPQTLEIARREHRNMKILRSDSHIPSAPAASMNQFQIPKGQNPLRLLFASFRLIFGLEKTHDSRFVEKMFASCDCGPYVCIQNLAFNVWFLVSRLFFEKLLVFVLPCEKTGGKQTNHCANNHCPNDPSVCLVCNCRNESNKRKNCAAHKSEPMYPNCLQPLPEHPRCSHRIPRHSKRYL